MEAFSGLAVALFVGCLIGIERGWKQRELTEQSRSLGLRTFVLIALAGGVGGLLAQQGWQLLVAAAALGLAALLALTYRHKAGEMADAGATTQLAAFVTFLLGVAATGGFQAQAAAVAVVVALLLKMKSGLHGWLHRLSGQELQSSLILLLMAVAILPLLPNQDMGPLEALNPRLIGWIVILIAGIEFAGYVAVRIAGSRYGMLLTGLLAGLMASTPLALAFSRIGRQQPAMIPTLVCAIAAASSMMFPRVLVVALLIAPSLMPKLAPPMLTMMLTGFILSFGLWWKNRRQPVPEFPLKNPFELMAALRFGLILSLIMLVVAAVEAWLGAEGLYAAALISGLMDVDPATVSFARLAVDAENQQVLVNAIVLAALANTLFKGALVWSIGGRRMGITMLAVLGPVLLSGLLWLFFS